MCNHLGMDIDKLKSQAAQAEQDHKDAVAQAKAAQAARADLDRKVAVAKAQAAQAEQDRKAAAAKARDTRDTRDRTFRALADQGLRPKDLQDATGLSREAVRQALKPDARQHYNSLRRKTATDT